MRCLPKVPFVFKADSVDTSVSVTLLFAHKVAQPTKLKFLPKNLSHAEKVFLEICAKKLTKTCGADFQSIETLNGRDRLKCARLLRVLDEVLDRTPSSSASGGKDINAESIIPHGRSFCNSVYACA